MSSITIRGLTKTFRKRSGEPLPVLGGVDLWAREGEFVCLLGPSGCGKSTTLNVLVGLVEPDGGQIQVDGAPSYRQARYGYVFQRPRLLGWKTVADNLTFALANFRFPRERWAEQVERYLQLVGLEDFGHEYPHALSGGMQQRVALARALTLNPQVLLLDEPFGALDEITRDRMNLELLRLVEQRRLTAVFVTHSIEEAVFLADRVVVMGRGASPRTGSSVVCEVEVNLPRPRTPAVKEDPAFFQIVRQGRAALREAQQA